MNTLTIANTAIRTDAEGRYCLNDLHRAAVASGVTKDIRPNEWMALSRTTELAESLIAENRRNTPISTSAGRYGGTYVARELVYDYAMWISPAFQLRVIRAYDAMVRQGVTASREGANGNEELESRVAALEAKEAERAATGREYASISAMRHKYGYPFSWEDLKEVSLQHGLRIRTMSNGKCGYHRLAWLEAYGIEL